MQRRMISAPQMIRAFVTIFFWIAATAAAQDASRLAEGQSFGKSISPSTKGQVINPNAVDPSAWGGNTSIGTTVPSGLDGFSSPMTGTDAFDQAKTLGLAGLGHSAMNKCQTYVPTCAHWVEPLRAITGDRFPIHSVFVVRAVAVQAIEAPSYKLYPAQTTEASQMEAAYRTYGVMPTR